VIFVMGGDGQLGSAFVRHLGDHCRPVLQQDLDLTREGTIDTWIERTRPGLVINCAAYTAVDQAEADEETARAINASAVGALATATARIGARFVTYSTDYVFDGRKETGYVESDPPHPLNVYGRTKLKGERLALKAHPDALVVRTSWLLSASHRNFLSNILDRLVHGRVSVVDDQRGRPTFVDDLVRATLAAIESGATGVLHLTNQGETTWYGLAIEIATLAGYDPGLVTPITSNDLEQPALRPANSVLDSERLEGLGLDPMPQWRETLRGLLPA